MEWAQLGIDIDGEAAADYSSYSISLSSDGMTVAIGAPLNDGVNGADSGHARVHGFNGTDWVQLGSDIDGEAAGDNSGNFISLSADGSTVAIGAPRNDGVNGTDSGHVRVYTYDNDGLDWVQRGTDIDGEAADDWLGGHAISLSSDGMIVAIGAILNDGVNGTDSGHVRVHGFNGTDWIQLGSDIDGEAAEDRSGRSVSLSADGMTVAIGAHRNDGVNSTDSGHVRVYTYASDDWQQLGSDIDGEAADDNSGSLSLSADGNTLAIGAILNDGVNGTDSGHVRVYTYASDDWTQLGSDIDGEAAGDKSGQQISLSADGTTVAIGSHWNDGVNGIDSGHVRVYTYDDGLDWTQLGSDIDGEAADDISGLVSISSDGSIVAIGAVYNDGNGDRSGHVRVYDLVSCLSQGTLSLGATCSTSCPNSCQVGLECDGS